MSAKDDGGSAFPGIFPAGAGAHAGAGMSLRDYFAAAALTGLLANGDGDSSPDAAVGAYQIADAMLTERSK